MLVGKRLAPSLIILMLALAGCMAPTPSASPLRLPTRVPRTPTPVPPDAQTYYEAGLSFQRVGDAENALQSFTWAIQLAPDFAPAYVARGSVYLARQQPDLALADANAALEANPTDAAAYVLRGEAMRMLGWPHTAALAFDRAVALDPTLKADTFRSRWLVARAIGDADRMLALSREYARAHPEDPLRYYYRGWALIELGRSDDAVVTLARGIEGSPYAPALLWFALGQAYAADSYWREALTCLETTRALLERGDASLTFHSDHPVADLFGALGLAYQGVGRCADAETMLEYALAVGAAEEDYAAALAEARLCQTPTPTATPYPTATPWAN